MERVRQLIADQPGAVSEIMRPTPVFAQGKQRGYRVYPGRNRQAFVRLGLRPGDLVTSINGTPLDDPSRGPEIFQTLSSATEARVTVVRSGRQQDLSLNMAQVAQQAEQVATESNPEAGEAQLQVPDEPASPDGDDSDE
jgi:general secretion pathway protein C